MHELPVSATWLLEMELDCANAHVQKILVSVWGPPQCEFPLNVDTECHALIVMGCWVLAAKG